MTGDAVTGTGFVLLDLRDVANGRFAALIPCRLAVARVRSRKHDDRFRFG
jgi:hypothetical protein